MIFGAVQQGISLISWQKVGVKRGGVVLPWQDWVIVCFFIARRQDLRLHLIDHFVAKNDR